MEVCKEITDGEGAPRHYPNKGILMGALSLHPSHINYHTGKGMGVFPKFNTIYQQSRCLLFA